MDCDGHAIGCEISVHPHDGVLSATPSTPPPAPHLELHGAGLDCAGDRRRRHNLYVGLLLESEAGAGGQTAAARLQDEALLCQLLAMA
jgi:hypothetical protein